MKVLFVCSGNGKTGISPIIKNQADSLIHEGIEIDYFLIKGKGIFGYLKNVLPLRKVLKNKNFDIVHAHYGFSGLLALMAKSHEKVIISYMGSDVLISGDFNFLYKLRSYIEVIINRYFAAHFFDYIILKSEEMSNILLKVNRKAVIPNGINFDLFEPLSKIESRKFLGIKEDAKVVLFSSDPSRPEKNFILAKNALELIKNDHLDLIFLKGIEHKELKYYYNSADVLLLTSFHEGSPNVIKEAIACNCLVVSTDVGDVKSLIEGVDGCYLCTYKPKEVAEKILRALEFKGKSNGRQKLIMMGLDQKSIALKIIGVYSELLDRT
jgi:teichuronic acid biosynthesis glycosyltransferase TuaC